MKSRIADFIKKTPSFKLLTHDFFFYERYAKEKPSNVVKHVDVPADLRVPLMSYQRIARIPAWLNAASPSIRLKTCPCFLTLGSRIMLTKEKAFRDNSN